MDKAIQVSSEVAREPLFDLMALDTSTQDFLLKDDTLVNLMES